MVLCVDEKSQVQALDRTAPAADCDGRRGAPTTTSATAPPACSRPNVASGEVIAQYYRRHRHQEFLRFLKLIDAAVPRDLDIHLVLDNYATHKTPAMKRWLVRHPRYHLHFTPTSPVVAEPGRAVVRRVDQPQAA